MGNLWRRFLCLMMALMLLLGTAALAEEDEVSLKELGLNNEEAISPDAAADDITVDEDEQGFVMDDAQAEQIDEQAPEVDQSVNPDDLELNAALSTDVTNILLVGVDTRDTTLDNGLQHGDVMIVLSVNKKDGSIKLTSMLRDLYVTIPGYKNKTRLNNAYARGGGALAMRTVNHNFNLNVQHYVTINFYGLASIIDAIGGIDVDLTKREAGAINTYLRKHPPKYDNTDGSQRVKLERVAGVQHLDGVQAVMYARLREIDNDFSRTARQRHLLELLLRQVTKDMTMEKLLSLVQACLPYVKTNMNASTMAELAVGVLQTGIVQKAQNGEELISQFRIPMDKSFSYKEIDGNSVVFMGTKNFPKNVDALHQFIYGAGSATD